MLLAKQSTAITVSLGPCLDSAGAEYTGLVIGDLTINKAGTDSAMAAAATLTHVSNGHYTLLFLTTNLGTLGTCQVRCNKATYQFPPLEFMVVPATVYDALVTNAVNATGGLTGATGAITGLAGVIATTTNITAATGITLTATTGLGNQTANITGTITTATNVTTVNGLAANVITAAATAADFGTEMATVIWTDTTASDFTTALSVGKSVMNGVTLGTGLTVARCTLTDTLTTYTGNTVQTGDSFARIGAAGVSLTSVALADATSDAVIADAIWNAATVTYGSAGSYGQLLETDLDATISSRLASASYTAPSNLTAAQIATGVWQDATAGDFTTASSIGKALYIANIAPGGSGGLLISGSNSGTTTFGALTVTGATTLTGNVALAAGLAISQSSVNTSALILQGNGTGAGLYALGGAGGAGIRAVGSSNDGIIVTAGGVAFNAITLDAGATSGYAISSGSSFGGLSLSKLTVSGTTTLTGAVSLGSTLGVTGTATLAALTVTAALTAGSNAIPWNAAWDAEVQSECDDAITASTVITAIDDFLDTEIAAIKAKTDNLPASPAAVGSAMTLTTGERDSIAAALLDLAAGIETGVTPRQAIRAMAAILAGIISGAGTGSEVFKAIGAASGGTTRATVTCDASGNRTAVSLP